MIFPEEFKECSIMSEKCPNCGQLTNTPDSRLVKEICCGHIKCRICLLSEEHGCKTCQHECYTRDNDDYREACSTSNDSDRTDKVSNEANILPLELVINKNTKSKENHYEPVFTDLGPSNLHDEDITVTNNKGVYESVTSDTISNNDSNKLHIPKIEPSDMVLNIEAQLKNGNNRKDSTSVQNLFDSQTEQRLDEKTAEKNEKPKRFDRDHITILSSNPEKYQCNVCGKVFRSKKGKCYHNACVTGKIPYKCTLCDRSFVKRSHFEYHEKVHSGDRPYSCTLCGKAFPQKNKLNRHMLSHSKEKQFLCSICNKRYSKQDDLKNHLNEHNATTTYTCKFCDKPFRILTNLKRHMRTHTSERPHTCDKCNKSFKDKSILIRHKRIHGKERPFSCANCNRVFLSKSELRRHLVVHSDEKPFSCKYCPTQFRRKDNLNRHIRHHHSEDSSYNETNNKVPPVVAKANQSCPAKSSNQQQRPRQKPRKIQPKSPGKVATNSPTNLHQINSRLDSMGNITPVIRTTAEVSNAVSVIKPIGTKQLEERACRRPSIRGSFIEPIPIDEVKALNCRIEERLYPQRASSHYFVRDYLKDGNSKVNSYPNDNDNELDSRDSSNAVVMISSPTESSFSGASAINRKKSLSSVCEEKCHQGDDETRKAGQNSGREDGNSEFKGHPDPGFSPNEQTNYVSTITHTVQHGDILCDVEATANRSATLPKDLPNAGKKKQSDVHWRRRTAETLKPCNR